MKDANDILRARGVDGLREAIDNAPNETIRPARPAAQAVSKFKLERWSEIDFAADEEWLIKGVLPRRGLAVIYGRPKAFKSFVALHIGLCVATGRRWAGRRVDKTPVVYIAAEGAAGLRKRKAGYVKAWPDLPQELDFALISAVPNLGGAPGDLPDLMQSIEASGLNPGLIEVDTMAKTLVAGDENGSGMTAFLANAAALAARFDCLVLAVHHVGLGEEAQKRPRGHSSLPGALDAQMLCERNGGELRAMLTLQKLKDEVDDFQFEAHLARVVVGVDRDKHETSTLIVVDVEEAQLKANAKPAPRAPASGRLLREIIVQAIEEAGETIRPFADGPLVRGVADDIARDRYYTRIAERTDPADDPQKLAERRRKAFSRAIKTELDAKRLTAAQCNGRRFLWPA
jgi:AAA domain